MQISSLIQALADGEFHSGSQLGAQLGVSRTAIWKALDRLDEFGLRYESHRGKGYRLCSPLDLLDLERVHSLLSSNVRSRVLLESVLSCPSTNSSVHQLQRQMDKPYTALFAEQQTSGRGRRGKSWQSPFAENIYLSMAMDWAKGPAALQGLSIVVGVVLAELLAEEGVPDVGLKWPNDVWVGRQKIAGILIELEGEVTTSWRVTLGLGLNTHMSKEAGESIDQPWTALSEFVSVRRSDLAAKLIERLCEALDHFSEHGFSLFRERYQEFDALHGEQVRLLGPEIEGVVRGVDDVGALLLEVDGAIRPYHAGELSVRLV